TWKAGPGTGHCAFKLCAQSVKVRLMLSAAGPPRLRQVLDTFRTRLRGNASRDGHQPEEGCPPPCAPRTWWLQLRNSFAGRRVVHSRLTPAHMRRKCPVGG